MDIIPKEKKYFSITTLKELGFSNYKINKLEDAGVLFRINRFTYENRAFDGDENDFCNASAYIPNGVICLMSAARYYGLTTFLPDVVDVAIERSSKVNTLPEWPSVRLYYFTQSRMEIGVRTVEEDGNSFHIFDVEKTVVDIIYYRNKVGIEETSEILKNYLRRPDRNIDRLHTYSRKLRCQKTLRTYLEVLL